MQPNRPGEVITPRPATQTPQPQTVPLSANQPADPTAVTSPAVGSAPVVAQPVELPAPAENGWSFHAEAETQSPINTGLAVPEAENDRPIQWTASEFIAHDKSSTWYAVLVALGVIGAVLIYLLTKDVFSSVIILIAAICFGVFAARKPRTISYALDDFGLHAGPRTYPFESFKSFSPSEEAAVAGIVFMPLKRFMPTVTIYVPSDVADNVLRFLSSRLPFEQHKPDAMDGLLRRIRF